MRYLLVDNGSLRASSVLNLRRVARDLSEATGLEILPSSLLHSSKVPVGDLEGEAAVNLERRIRLFLEAGERDFTIIPFFFGKSGAITGYLPERLAYRREKHGDFNVWRTPFLAHGLEEKSQNSIDLDVNHKLVDILADRVREVIRDKKLSRPKVAVVDHGSPKPEVAMLRNEVSCALAGALGNEVCALFQSSMERREGDEFAFNEPLLEKLLRHPEWNHGDVVISMLFLSPGRHAGQGGDIDGICKAAEAESPGLRTHMTGLVGDHPGMIPLLQQRLEMERIPM
ncbi:cobalamin biosynthesis protein CbiX [Puniceicoccales bacterium CK1056]|uniref:Cobalamin biosynthesis protein CbiX n=1 Tax=Oceanipulchritudo coccoides TaxID=2706888 RepID=A0A6B2M0P0_9BACT|nr:CbiX/SirB N-terminal domain-containing protein [Oceanipulchritudo coccoides]NDV62478.1 cobalamin biosynthesis protein CbiX [Oceanipulchritudo coccoides]